jgi:hypothetical protein
LSLSQAPDGVTGATIGLRHIESFDKGVAATAVRFTLLATATNESANESANVTVLVSDLHP